MNYNVVSCRYIAIEVAEAVVELCATALDFFGGEGNELAKAGETAAKAARATVSLKNAAKALEVFGRLAKLAVGDLTQIGKLLPHVRGILE